MPVGSVFGTHLPMPKPFSQSVFLGRARAYASTLDSQKRTTILKKPQASTLNHQEAAVLHTAGTILSF